MKTSRLRTDQIIAKNYKMLHRNVYMGEKVEYYKRIKEAKESGGKVLSFIIDGMSKWSTRLPILAHTATFSPQFPQHVMGVIAHCGDQTRYYVHYPNVKAGASFTIHCIHSEVRSMVQ